MLAHVSREKYGSVREDSIYSVIKELGERFPITQVLEDRAPC